MCTHGVNWSSIIEGMCLRQLCGRDVGSSIPWNQSIARKRLNNFKSKGSRWSDFLYAFCCLDFPHRLSLNLALRWFLINTSKALNNT